MPAGYLPGHFSSTHAFAHLPPMPRWLKFTLPLLLGLAAGLLYGWVISPVEFVDTTPSILSPDYQTDTVLMVAEAYASDRLLEPALRALAFLSAQPPLLIATSALDYARAANYSQSDLLVLQNLLSALQSLPAGVTP